MHVKLSFRSSYAQAQKFIIDVAHQLTHDRSDDIKIVLEGDLDMDETTMPNLVAEWTTTPPTRDGYYWCQRLPGQAITLVYVDTYNQELWVSIVGDDNICRLDGFDAAYWFGPLPEPMPPAIDDDPGVPLGAVPSVAGAVEDGPVFDD